MNSPRTTRPVRPIAFCTTRMVANIKAAKYNKEGALRATHVAKVSALTMHGATTARPFVVYLVAK